MKKQTLLALTLAVSLGLTGCSHMMATNQEKVLESNKEIVVKMYEEALFKGNVDAIDKYVAEDYIQHNPHVGDGKEAVKEYIKTLTPIYKKKGKPLGEIVRVIAEKDLVVLHLKDNTYGGNGSAVIDIFRLENGMIVEHWDVIQDIPSESANNNTMF